MPATRALRIPQQNPHKTTSAGGILYPLDVLYARTGVPGPTARRTAPGRIPPPYHQLLVHENEMTSALEGHFGGTVTVRVLASFSRGRSYFRRVLLALEATGTPVAMGAVRIRLDAFQPAVRSRILKGQVPLGRILRDAKVAYTSRPTTFLEVTPNADLMAMFWMPGPRVLYGRQTQVTVGDVRIGDIVEVLPLV